MLVEGKHDGPNGAAPDLYLGSQQQTLNDWEKEAQVLHCLVRELVPSTRAIAHLLFVNFMVDICMLV